MFQGSLFLVVESAGDAELSGPGLADLLSRLEENDAQVVVKRLDANDANMLEAQDIPTHIISNSTHFIEYATALLSMIPVTTPQWVWDSLLQQRVLNPVLYTPDPRFFFKDVFVCVADNLPAGDKEIIYGGVRAFGGRYLDALTKYTTHLVAVDMLNDKSIIAVNAAPEAGVDIKVVTPRWIDECLKTGKHVSEAGFLVGNDELVAPEAPSALVAALLASEVSPTAHSPFLEGKRFHISADCNLSPHLHETVAALIANNGGKVVPGSRPLQDQIDVLICQYRDDEEYTAMALAKPRRIIIGTLQWLYSVVLTGQWTLPLQLNLLHYPVPRGPLPGFEGLKICITNYTGEARLYLARLIAIMGGIFTKTLTKENDYLVAAKPVGKKYEAATFKWALGGIKVVNHLWLETCFSQWQVADWQKGEFQFLEEGGVERLIGRVHLDENVIRAQCGDAGIAERTSEVATEPPEPMDNSPVTRGSSDGKPETAAASALPATLTRLLASPSPRPGTKGETAASTPTTLPAPAAPAAPAAPSSSTVVPASLRGRSAKLKAAEKLHSDMADLNQYQKTKNHKRDPYFEDFPPLKRPKSSSGMSSTASIVAVTTGCEQELSLSRLDLVALEQVGIIILPDFSYKAPINTLIAPRIMRTEKFLKSLSQVRQVVHPSYISNLLKRLGSSSVDHEFATKEYKIEDFSLDKVLGRKAVNLELGMPAASRTGLTELLASDVKGNVFAEMLFNLSVNLNGGPEVIAKILEAHGSVETKVVKGATFKNLLLTNNEAILIAHKVKDAKTIATFKKGCKGVVLDWDWCVKSIFKMKRQEYKQYQL